MAKVNWSLEAIEDLDQIHRYFPRYSRIAADCLASRVFASVTRLEDFPLYGRIVPEFDVTDLREIIIGEFRVIYQLQSDDVHVIAVRHGARRLEGLDFSH